MHMLGPQRDSKPRSVESKAEALSVGLWELLRVFPSLFTLKRSIRCNKAAMVALNASLKCIVALDATCRLTLSIFHFISVDGFMTSFLPFRSTFGIFNLFDNEFKSKATEGIESPIFWIEVRRLIRSAMRPVEVFRSRFFCSEWLRWGVKWHTLLAIVSLCPSIFARNWLSP